MKELMTSRERPAKTKNGGRTMPSELLTEIKDEIEKLLLKKYGKADVGYIGNGVIFHTGEKNEKLLSLVEVS